MGVSVGFAVEPDDASVVDDAVDDGGGHVAVAEHVAPSAELEVRGEDDASPFVAVGDDPGTGAWRRRCRWAGSRARSMMSRSALPMVLSSWSSLLSVLALRSRMIRPEAVKNLTGMPCWHARVPMAMARRGPARMPASSVEHEVLGVAE